MHPPSDKDCPRRKFLENRDKDKERAAQKKTYAEMFQLYDPNSVMPGEINNESFSLNLGTRKERNQTANKPSTSLQSPQRKRQRVDKKNS